MGECTAVGLTVTVSKGPHEQRDGRGRVKQSHQVPPSPWSPFTRWEVKEDKDTVLDIVCDNMNHKHVRNDLDGFRKRLVVSLGESSTALGARGFPATFLYWHVCCLANLTLSSDCLTAQLTLHPTNNITLEVLTRVLTALKKPRSSHFKLHPQRERLAIGPNWNLLPSATIFLSIDKSQNTNDKSFTGIDRKLTHSIDHRLQRIIHTEGLVELHVL